MARHIYKLTAVSVNRQQIPGYYADGGGLYLQVIHAQSKSWIFRYMRYGVAHEMGLGSFHTVSLAEAREKALFYRKLLQEGKDPLFEKRKLLQQQQAASARLICFSECAQQYIASHRDGWKNAKHASQWQSTLEQYAFPVIGNIAPAEIDTGLVMKILDPIWAEKTETATRLRGRIEKILDWAKVRGYRDGENPARWKGHLENLLPARSKVAKVGHHPALAYIDTPEFIQKLQQKRTIPAYALELLILTATRTSEIAEAEWREIDLGTKLWVIPASRMKMKKEHRVPLSKQAIQILKHMQSHRVSDYVFTGKKINTGLSQQAMLMTLRRLGYGDYTVHGFRSTFRDWCAECTDHPREVAEIALAHALENKVEAAYLRGDLFEKRRILMQDWADFLAAHIK